MVKELVINDFIFRGVSTFRSSKWQQFLSNLRAFRLDLPGDDSGSRKSIVSWNSYAVYREEFPTWFFAHLREVEQFEIHTHWTRPLGLNAPLAIQYNHLPNLLRIELSYVFISQAFLDFLLQRAPQIEKIIMRDAIAHSPSTPDSLNITWADLLSSIRRANPPSLVEFDIRPLKRPDGWDHLFRASIAKQDRDQIKEHLETHPQRMVFLYGFQHFKDKT